MLTQVKRTHKVRHLFQRYRLSKVAAISNRPSTRDPAKVGYHLKKSLGWEVKRLHGASFVFFPTSCFFLFFSGVCLLVCVSSCVCLLLSKLGTYISWHTRSLGTLLPLGTETTPIRHKSKPFGAFQVAFPSKTAKNVPKYDRLCAYMCMCASSITDEVDVIQWRRAWDLLLPQSAC